MKKTLCLAGLLLAGFSAFGQSYNPYLIQGIVTPAPLLPAEFNGTGTVAFDVGNTGSTPIPVVAGQEMLLTLTLSYGVPNNVDPIAAVSGPGAAWFAWEYFPGTRTYRGTQIATIPGGSRQTINIAYRVTENSFFGSTYRNGFNVNLSPPGYTNPQPTDDDTVAFYTYVQAFDFGDAPASYGIVQHEINLRKTLQDPIDPLSATFNQYIYLGSVVDPESAMQSSATAANDDNNQTGGMGADDEDGVVFPPMVVGSTVTIPVSVTIMDEGFETVTPRLSGWIDWNLDGDFLDAGERIATNVSVIASGVVPLTVTVPSNAWTNSPIYARFRIGPSVAGPTGNSNFGEVEDYQIQLMGPVNLGGRVWEDSDRDGVVDLGEPGLDNSVVSLFLADGVTPALDVQGNSIPSQTISVGLGTYNFTNLPPGSYVVRVTPPPPRPDTLGWRPAITTSSDPNDDVLSDSNGRSVSGQTYVQSLPMALMSNAEPDTPVDGDGTSGNLTLSFGFYPWTIQATFTAAYAAVEDGRMVVRWGTSSEIGTIGFLVHRSDKENGEYEQVTSTLVPGLMTSAQGGEYAWVDTTADIETRWFYRIEEKDAHGDSTVFGPFASGGPASGVAPALPVGQATLAQARVEPPVAVQARAVAGENRARALKSTVVPAGPQTALKVMTRGVGLRKVPLAQIAKAFGLTELTVKTRLQQGTIRVARQGVVVPARVEGVNLVFSVVAANSPYSDQAAYMIVQAAGGKTPAIRDARPRRAPDASVFNETREFRERRQPMLAVTGNLAGDYWYWDFMNAHQPEQASKVFPVDISGLGSGPSRIVVGLHGFTGLNKGPEEHKAVVSVNGREIGSVVWSGIAPKVFEAVLPAGTLVEGRNEVRVTSELLPGIPYEAMVLQSIRVIHPRKFIAENGRLRFQAGPRQTTAQVFGFSSTAVVIWDVTAPGAPVRLSNARLARNPATGKYNVTFAVTAGRVYEAVQPGLLAGAESATPVNLAAMRAVRDGVEGAEYVVIAPPGLESGARAIAGYRASKGLTCQVVALQDIYNAFNFGEESPLAIRTFLAAANARWAQKPKYVLLAGSGTYDYNNNMRLGDNLVPVQMIQTPFGAYAADSLLADVVGGDGVPDLAIGRLSARSNEELQACLEKIRRFEESSEAWKQQVCLTADRPDSAGDFHSISDILAGTIASGVAVDKIYYGPGQLGLDQARSAVSGAFASGRGLMSYMGHGAMDRLSSSALLSSQEAGLLTNTGREGVLMALTCSIGRFEQPGFDALGEVLSRNASGGSVAVWSPSGQAISSQALQLGLGFLESRYQDGETVLGDAILSAHRKYASEAPDRYRIASIFNLLGDPALCLTVSGTGAGSLAGEAGGEETPRASASATAGSASPDPVAPVPVAASAGEEDTEGASGAQALGVVQAGLQRVSADDNEAVQVRINGVAVPVLRVPGAALWYQAAAGEVTLLTGADASPAMAAKPAEPAGTGEARIVSVAGGPVVLRLEEAETLMLSVGAREMPVALDITDPAKPVVLTGTELKPAGAAPALYLGAKAGDILLADPSTLPEARKP